MRALDAAAGLPARLRRGHATGRPRAEKIEEGTNGSQIDKKKEELDEKSDALAEQLEAVMIEAFEEHGRGRVRHIVAPSSTAATTSPIGSCARPRRARTSTG
jgi:hypothetical protein